MSLGVRAIARIPSRGGRPPTRDALLAEIRAAVEAALKEPGLNEPALSSFIDFGTDEHALQVLLHPHSEALEFEWSPDQTLAATVKTSTTGPGFHAFVVELLDEVGRACGLAWEWEEDPAEYAAKRDFGALQGAMAEFLQRLAEVLMKHSPEGSDNSLAINFDAGSAIPEMPGAFSVTPSGPRSREWWTGVRHGQGLAACAAEFYQWWDREIDAAWHVKLGLAYLWCDVRWHPPANEYEENFFRHVLETFASAKELDPTVWVPEQELEELAALLESTPDEAPVPGPGIGYFRGQVTFRLPGGWSVTLPGYYYEDEEDDGGTAVFWHRDRTVRVTTYTVRDQRGEPTPAERLLATCRESMAGGHALEFTDLNGMRCLSSFGHDEEDGEKFQVLLGAKARDGHVARVTIAFDHDDSKPWAKGVFTSMTGPVADDAE